MGWRHPGAGDTLQDKGPAFSCSLTLQDGTLGEEGGRRMQGSEGGMWWDDPEQGGGGTPDH